MEQILRFVLAALATWRLSFLLAREDGPWQVFVRLRRAMGESVFGRSLRCVKCTSMWVALPFDLFLGGTWTMLVVQWLALSGAASLADEWTRPPFEWKETKEDDNT